MFVRLMLVALALCLIVMVSFWAYHEKTQTTSATIERGEYDNGYWYADRSDPAKEILYFDAGDDGKVDVVDVCATGTHNQRRKCVVQFKFTTYEPAKVDLVVQPVSYDGEFPSIIRLSETSAQGMQMFQAYHKVRELALSSNPR